MAICSENEGLRVERECECLQIDGSEATVGKEERKEELRSGTAVLLLYTWQKSSNGRGDPGGGGSRGGSRHSNQQ